MSAPYTFRVLLNIGIHTLGLSLFTLDIDPNRIIYQVVDRIANHAGNVNEAADESKKQERPCHRVHPCAHSRFSRHACSRRYLVP